MPELFPDIPTFIACCLIMAGAQLVYATVGFGAGMFAVALMAMILPDLAGAVTVLLVLTLVTEVWVLARAWRHARPRLLLGLLPTMVIGLWIGTQILLGGSAEVLKRALGAVIVAAGMWFLRQDGMRSASESDVAVHPRQPARSAGVWWSVPAGLISGVLGGVFGTGGPPAIIFLRGCRLEKGAFRATLLWYFLTMSLIRGGMYVHGGLLNLRIVWAALWLLPASVGGALLGMLVHDRLGERHFATAVSVLLIGLGVLLLLGVER